MIEKLKITENDTKAKGRKYIESRKKEERREFGNPE